MLVCKMLHKSETACGITSGSTVEEIATVDDRTIGTDAQVDATDIGADATWSGGCAKVADASKSLSCGRVD